MTRTLIAGLALISAGTSARAQSPCPRAALAPFLPLVGTWTVAWESRINDSLFTTPSATASIEYAAGRCGIIERLEGDFRGERAHVVSLITAPANDSLQLTYLDSWHGGAVVFTARPRGDTVTFLWQRDWGNHVQLVRRVYSAITPTSLNSRATCRRTAEETGSWYSVAGTGARKG